MTTGTVDVAVLGAGPAGALAARELARAGVSVLVLERDELPRWKVCGSCVGPAATAVLGEAGLGTLPARHGAVPLRELVLVAPGGRSARVPLRGGVTWSRAAMDHALAREAEAAGAEVRTGVRAELGPVEEGARLVRARPRSGAGAYDVRARVVLDATGLGGAPGDGTTPRSLDDVRGDARIGLGTIFGRDTLLRPVRGTERDAEPLPAGRVVMALGGAGYVGLVRLEDGTVDVAAAVDPSVLDGRAPGEAVAWVLASAGLTLDGSPSQAWRGTPGLTRRPERAADERWLRIGDALGYVEPFTGEGIGWALASARAAAPVALRAVAGWTPQLADDWEAYRAGAAARARRICRAASWGLRRPALVRMAVSALDHAPWLATPVLRRVARGPERPRSRPAGTRTRRPPAWMIGGDR